jgi:hypothetical protein
MDIANIAGGGLTALGQQIDVGVLGALQNLDRNVANELFSSLGLGTLVDTYA